jgi:hypothetical protein
MISDVCAEVEDACKNSISGMLSIPDSDRQMHGPLSHVDKPMISEKEKRPPRRELEER